MPLEPPGPAPATPPPVRPVDLPKESFAETPTPLSSPSPARQPAWPAASVLTGPGGPRAGWVIALFALLFYLANWLLHGLTDALWPMPPAELHDAFARHRITVALSLHGSAPTLIAVLLATRLIARIERRPFTSYGLGGTHRLRNFAAGALTGLGAMALLVCLLRLTHALVFDGRSLSATQAVASGLTWLAAFGVVALLEETLLRGALQFTLTRGLAGVARAAGIRDARPVGFAAAAVLLSLLFGAGHRSNPGESPMGLLTAVAAGLLWCCALFRTGSLWWPIGFHVLWDWAESFLFGVADSGMRSTGALLASHPAGAALLSGGATGPEGSLLALPVLAIAASILLLTTARRPPGPAPQVPARPLDARPAAAFLSASPERAAKNSKST